MPSRPPSSTRGPSPGGAGPSPFASIEALDAALRERNYFAPRGLTTAIFLSLKLGRPLFLEGEAGTGKTEVAKVLAAILDTELIRLQCYEGLDVHHAVYEWNYARQMMHIRLLESRDETPPERELFSPDFLEQRPLLQAIDPVRTKAPVLLVDEVDRADAEFEAYLLEVLSDFQITIPEIGTIKAAHPPVVVVTSNRTREVHDALKRRCLYCWIDYPSFEEELAIVRAKVPGASEKLSREVARFVQELRAAELYKLPGIAETLDWAAALVALDRRALDADIVGDTLGILLKYQDDVEKVRGEGGARDRGPRPGRRMTGQLLANVLAFGRVLRGLGPRRGPRPDARPRRRPRPRAGRIANADFRQRRAGPLRAPPRRDRPLRRGLRGLLAKARRGLDHARPALDGRAPQAAPPRVHVRASARRAAGSRGRRRAGRRAAAAAPSDADLERAGAAAPQGFRRAHAARSSRTWSARSATLPGSSPSGARAGCAPGDGNTVDLRRTLRRSLPRGGEILDWSRRGPRTKPRPIVVLADISGSMERYTRLLLLFLYSLTRGLGGRVEAFLFGTRLTRVTRELEGRDPAEALDRSRAAPSPTGPAERGSARRSREFNLRWARRVLGQGAVVLFISDGWDRGDPDALRTEMARLQRSAHRLIWLNPLLGAPDYEPLARGMRTALPFVDDFLPVHNLASLEALGRHLEELPADRPARRQQTRPRAAGGGAA